LEERRRGVEWRGERGGAHDGGAAAGLDERHGVIPADFVSDADAAVELDEVGANAEENVLAVVDDFAGAGVFVGGSASAEVGAALEESDAEAGVGEGAGGGEAGEAAAGYGYGGWGGLSHAEILAELVATENGSSFLTGRSARFGMTGFC
jgi:hypothetical protein